MTWLLPRDTVRTAHRLRGASDAQSAYYTTSCGKTVQKQNYTIDTREEPPIEVRRRCLPCRGGTA